MDKQRHTSTAKYCVATRRDGQPCQAYACADSDYCFAHDPAKAKQRARARAKGGRARHGRTVGAPGDLAELETRPFKTLQDMTALLEIAVRETLRLENSISRNRCLGYLARCWADLYQAGELEQRIEAIEQLLERRP